MRVAKSLSWEAGWSRQTKRCVMRENNQVRVWKIGSIWKTGWKKIRGRIKWGWSWRGHPWQTHRQKITFEKDEETNPKWTQPRDTWLHQTSLPNLEKKPKKEIKVDKLKFFMKMLTKILVNIPLCEALE